LKPVLQLGNRNNTSLCVNNLCEVPKINRFSFPSPPTHFDWKNSPSMMMGTILRTLFDFGQLRIAQGIPQEIIRHVEDAHPIPQLIS
tara:strand:+ start:166 stop:426 length:261 start_codon:yes stop_codon:yes gene_type:complete